MARIIDPSSKLQIQAPFLKIQDDLCTLCTHNKQNFSTLFVFISGQTNMKDFRWQKTIFQDGTEGSLSTLQLLQAACKGGSDIVGPDS